ncbi:conserved membrane hypothetical protein [Candidatus Desulfosporosinus infrequens]|uniref:Uncharacterized protein n=1 Tax=Candidatus Desulfosporosinus infrequens TaxID=2043169 RepID=A0A2U3LDT3_9FIRM|nr:conserved membrane hypothetical protein [Candidatus Desulfosporosinus infrequens]
MFGSQQNSLCREPLSMGIGISAPISSEVGSSSVFFAQPLLTGNVLVSWAVLIGSELFLFIAGRLFNLESVPILDSGNGQTVQMPLTELQEFLRWMGNGSGSSPNPDPATNAGNMVTNPAGQIGGVVPGFVTVTTPEAPIVVSIYVSADYSIRPFTPSTALFIPILTFPGVRGALPLLILGLLLTIFVRAVVPPESSGLKPLSKPKSTMNNPLTFTPNDLLQLLNRFGKHFGSK